MHGADASDMLRRFGAVDPANPPYDRAAATMALMAMLGALGLPPRPVIWRGSLVEWWREDATGYRLGDYAADLCFESAIGPHQMIFFPQQTKGWHSTNIAARFDAASAAWSSVHQESDYFFDVSPCKCRYVFSIFDCMRHFSARATPAVPAILSCFEAGVEAFFVTPRRIFAIPQPMLRIQNGRLHCETGPAVVWRDGNASWFWRGVAVPQFVIERPAQITRDLIDVEPNSEVMRVMIERFGWERYADECGAQLIDHDERWGSLYCRKRMRDPARDRLLFLRVLNRSPEPDGSFRHYVLPVHPELRPIPDSEAGETQFGDPQALTALNAVASTFGMRGAEYAARLGAES